MTEIWNDIPDYEGLYKVSNLGRIMSVRTGEIMFQRAKPQKKGHLPYLQTLLSKEGKRKFYAVHRLVAAAFYGPIPEGMVVLHDDDDPQNNKLSNLRIGTQAENVRECYEKGRMPINIERLKSMSEKGVEARKRKVIATNLTTGEVSSYDGVREAGRALGLLAQNISGACAGIRKRVKGYSFNYL